MQNGMLMSILGVVLIVMNLISFGLMAYDKRCAAKGKWRVPERTLFLVAGLFGAIGGTIGMHLFHHKTNHWNFRAFFPTMKIVQIATIGFVAFKVFS